jgi:hypothetical protein
MMTENALKESIEFKNHIGDDKIMLIHDPYFESNITPAFIVIHSNKKSRNRFTITRFWKRKDNIMVSVDHKNKTAEEVFKILLFDYSRGLE